MTRLINMASETWLALVGLAAASLAAVVGWATAAKRGSDLKRARKRIAKSEIAKQRAESKLRMQKRREEAETGLLDDTGKIIEEIKDDSKNGNLAELVNELSAGNREVRRVGKPGPED